VAVGSTARPGRQAARFGHNILTVYSTCIFCHAALGQNEAIEAFPVGRRLAFDAEKGRLWVVCPACARWNLTPLESRWEAIEECERSFRETKLRASTGEIGLARIREGTTLVRVGNPLMPEMAAWRYGQRFTARRRKHFAVVGATVIGTGAVIIGGPLAGVIGWSSALSVINIVNMARNLRRPLKVPVEGEVHRLTELNVQAVRLRPGLGLDFELEFGRMDPGTFRERLKKHGLTQEHMPPVTLRGEPAIHAARHLLTRMNSAGGSESRDTIWYKRPVKNRDEKEKYVFLSALPTPIRLAMEMSTNEHDERRAMEGELAALEERWREAEEIAAIADDLFVPKAVRDSMERLKG
jgi:hypothetical protein